ncbi:hypothetical protein F0Q45_14075 [Mycobacterium simiae]|uniref:Uncharacterized protein n=1 Tax=Mycobacterium simiae TaxID=1784 RepID=A0A5B1BP90_MYCSI|nr:hypothetical protein F0Q45_14075 [Mycobacterium simiae]
MGRQRPGRRRAAHIASLNSASFVMRGLNRINPLDAITAMRAINAEPEANTPPPLTACNRSSCA